MKHTSGTRSINDWPQDTTDITIGAVLTPLIAKTPLRDVSINEQKANARRIVACINACEGFSIEELEGADLFKDSIESQSEIVALKQQRDELLYALQEFVRTMDSLPESDETNLRVWDMYQIAQAAIKKLRVTHEPHRPRTVGAGCQGGWDSC